MDTIFDRVLDNITKFLSCTATACMILIVVFNVFSRTIFSKSLLFAEELGYMFFIYSVFFGVCVVYKRMGLITIDIVVDKLPPLVNRIVLTFTFVLLFVVNLILLWFSWNLTIGSWTRTTPSLGIPYFFNYLSPTLAFLILAYYSLRFFMMEIKGEKIEELPMELKS